MRTKSQFGSFNLSHLPILLPPVTAKQRVVTIPDQPEEGINRYEEKDFQKRKVLRREVMKDNASGPYHSVSLHSTGDCILIHFAITPTCTTYNYDPVTYMSFY